MATLALDRIDPTVFGTDGGRLFSIFGDFTAGAALRVDFIAGGLTLPAYSGIPGQGRDIYPFARVVSGVFPRPPPGAPRLFTVRAFCATSGETAELTDAVTLAPPFASSQTYALRSAYPSTDATGPRSIDEEPPA